MDNITQNKHISAQDLGLVDRLKVVEKASSSRIFSLAIRRLLQNGRQGTVACKTRAQVTGSTRKPWKQKGTGRARAGTVKSPLWRGGGVIFGPQKRSRRLKITRTLNRHAMVAVVRTFLDEKRIILFGQKFNEKPSTKNACKAISAAGLNNTMINVFVPFDDSVTMLSFRNIPFVRIVLFDSASAYSLADAEKWVLFEKDKDAFKEMVEKWI